MKRTSAHASLCGGVGTLKPRSWEKGPEDFNRACKENLLFHDLCDQSRFLANLLDLLSASSMPQCCLVWERVKSYYLEAERRLAVEKEQQKQDIEAWRKKRDEEWEAKRRESWEAELKNLMEVIKTRKGKIPSRESEEKEPKAKQAEKSVTSQRVLYKTDLSKKERDRMNVLADIPDWTWSHSEDA